MCAERLVPLIHKNIKALFAEKYFAISTEVKEKLKTISPATVTRLIKLEREKNKIRGTCTTNASSSLNKLIPIRTYFYLTDRILSVRFLREGMWYIFINIFIFLITLFTCIFYQLYYFYIYGSKILFTCQ